LSAPHLAPSRINPSSRFTVLPLTTVAMDNQPLSQHTPITEAMQRLAAKAVSLVTRRLTREYPSFARYPGVSWAKGDDAVRMRIVDQFCRDCRQILALNREFDNCALRGLRVMTFESTQCMDLAQLGNNVRITICLRVITALSYHTMYVRHVTFAS
jgi:hypothetical protein